MNFIEMKQKEIKKLEEKQNKLNSQIQNHFKKIEYNRNKYLDKYVTPLEKTVKELQSQIYKLEDELQVWAKNNEHKHLWFRRWYKRDHYDEGMISQCRLCGEKDFTGF